MTNQPMSREQVLAQLGLLTERIEKGECWIDHESALLDTDAALRAENERLKERIGRLEVVHHQHVADFDKHYGTPCEQIRHQQEVDDLCAQVTALEQDKADSQTANAALREELEQLRADYRSEQRMSEDLEQQLAAMTQERVTAMEEQLKIAIPPIAKRVVVLDDDRKEML